MPPDNVSHVTNTVTYLKSMGFNGKKEVGLVGKARILGVKSTVFKLQFTVFIAIKTVHEIVC